MGKILRTNHELTTSIVELDNNMVEINMDAGTVCVIPQEDLLSYDNINEHVMHIQFTSKGMDKFNEGVNFLCTICPRFATLYTKFVIQKNNDIIIVVSCEEIEIVPDYILEIQETLDNIDNIMIDMHLDTSNKNEIVLFHGLDVYKTIPITNRDFDEIIDTVFESIEYEEGELLTQYVYVEGSRLVADE